VALEREALAFGHGPEGAPRVESCGRRVGEEDGGYVGEGTNGVQVFVYERRRSGRCWRMLRYCWRLRESRSERCWGEGGIEVCGGRWR
jgi:hypothetical protein